MRPPVIASNCCLGLGHQRRRAREAELDRAEVDLARAHVRMIEERDVERRHAVEERRLHLLDRREQVVDVARVRDERERVGPMNASACTPTLP